MGEFENNIRRERQRAGIAKTKASGGVYKGRRAGINTERIRELAAQGMTANSIARELGATANLFTG